MDENSSSVTPREEERILVLDFGSQTAQLIARRIREQNVFCQLVRHDLPADRIRELNPKGLILSGGPASVYGENSPHPDSAIFDLDVPILGICYGMQLACLSQGSKVQPGHSREFGRTSLRSHDTDLLFQGIPLDLTVWMSHGDQVEDLSNHFVSLAETDTCPFAAVKHKDRPIYGLQFHPEVTHTEHGGRLLSNFVTHICGCKGTWRISSLIAREIEVIRERVGSDRVICGLSGGVDSSVTAALLFKSIGPQLSCIFVDNGLLRKD
ncbi:MAG: glutamine-hydrolyzing GMP synthase, partial [Planctomycetaceae bacterium]|nr:glutamine-hydrolyzing GMP synthase [Planctomycetaceae bacterium]